MTVDIVLFRNLRFLKLSQVAYLIKSVFFLKIIKKKFYSVQIFSVSWRK